MRKTILFLFVVCAGFGLLVNAGCAKKAASSSEAIQQAQTLKSVEEKVDYLVKQAESFYNSKEFQKAVETAQYVLSNLDKNSQPAKDLLEKAKTQLQAAASKAVGDATNKLLGK